MIRLSASLSRKVPVPGIEFSSQQFGASMEVEVGDTDRPEAIQQRLRELYQSLSFAIDEQIAAATNASGQAAEHDNGGYGHRQPGVGQQVRKPNDGSAQPRVQGSPAGNGNGQRGNRRGQVVPATIAQVKAIKAIAADQGLDLGAALAPYQVNSLGELTIRDASKLIDELKAKKGNGARR